MKLESENWKRELWIGDNLAIMRQMNSESVDLIYLDPPFNSKRMYEGNLDPEMGKQSFSDIWGDSDITEDDRRILRERNPLLAELISFLGKSHGVSWQSYLSFMGIRLMEMHRLLKDTGSIYLHCDWHMNAPLRLLMDIIFGAMNFRNEIIWFYNDTPGRPVKDFARKHDAILRYAAGKKYVFNAADVQVPVRPESIARYKTARKLGGKEYVGGSATKTPESVWNFPAVKRNSKESTGWATQKPIALLNRIIKASSNKGDVVLDPFCGCGTACIAATHLGRQWIGIDKHSSADAIMKQRIQTDTKLAPEWDGVKVLSESDAAKLPKRTDVAPFKKDERTKRTIYERQKGKCASGELCLNGTDAKPINFMHFDRKISATRGGGYTWDNVQLLCSTCNISKGKKTWKVFIDGLRRAKAADLLNQIDSPEME